MRKGSTVNIFNSQLKYEKKIKGRKGMEEENEDHQEERGEASTDTKKKGIMRTRKPLREKNTNT